MVVVSEEDLKTRQKGLPIHDRFAISGGSLCPKMYHYTQPGMPIGDPTMIPGCPDGIPKEKADMIDAYVEAKAYREIRMREELAYAKDGSFRMMSFVHKDIEEINREMDRMEREFTQKYLGEGLYGVECMVKEVPSNRAGTDWIVSYDRSHTDPAAIGLVNPRDIKDGFIGTYLDGLDSLQEHMDQADEYAANGDTEGWKHARMMIGCTKTNLDMYEGEYEVMFPGERLQEVVRYNLDNNIGVFNPETGLKRPCMKIVEPLQERAGSNITDVVDDLGR